MKTFHAISLLFIFSHLVFINQFLIVADQTFSDLWVYIEDSGVSYLMFSLNYFSYEKRSFIPFYDESLSLIIIGGFLPGVSGDLLPLFVLQFMGQILTALLWKKPPWKPTWKIILMIDSYHGFSMYLRIIQYPLQQIFFKSRDFHPKFNLAWCWFLWNMVATTRSGDNFQDGNFKVKDEASYKRYRWRRSSMFKCFSYLNIWKISVVPPKEVFDKRKDIRSQNKKNINSTFLSRTRLHTNWYLVNNSKHVTDAMVFYSAIWKAKEAIAI